MTVCLTLQFVPEEPTGDPAGGGELPEWILPERSGRRVQHQHPEQTKGHQGHRKSPP